MSSLRDSPSSRGLLESRGRIMERRPMQQGNRTTRRKCPTSLPLLQLPNIAKTAISITKAVPTTANMKYISLGEDGATFIAMPRAIPNQLSYGGDPKGN